MENLTLELLPNAVSQLSAKLDRIERLLIDEKAELKLPESLLTIEQAAEFLTLSKATIYSKVSRNELPFMKRDKRLYFSQAELMDYIKEGRHKTVSEMEQEAGSFVNNKKGGLQS